MIVDCDVSARKKKQKNKKQQPKKQKTKKNQKHSQHSNIKINKTTRSALQYRVHAFFF